jgi:hypothetical protein
MSLNTTTTYEASEIAHQLDLPGGEWPHFLPVDRNRTDQRVLFEHRNAEKGAGATIVHKRNERWRA